MESERRTSNAQRPMAEDQKSEIRCQSHAATSSAGEDRKRTTRPRDYGTTRQ
jgi:hypothetical protein